jgi:hypothetical protein
MVASKFASAKARLRLFFAPSKNQARCPRDSGAEDVVPLYGPRDRSNRRLSPIGVIAALLLAFSAGRMAERIDWPLLLQALGYAEHRPLRAQAHEISTQAAGNTINGQLSTQAPLPRPANSTLEPGMPPPSPLPRFDIPQTPALLHQGTSSSGRDESGVDVQLDEAPQTERPEASVEVELN